MGQKYIRNEDGTVDRIDGNYIYRSDGSVDWIDGNYIHRDGGKVDWVDGNYIYRSDGSIDWRNGNYIHHNDGAISWVDGDIQNNCTSNNSTNDSQLGQQGVRTRTVGTYVNTNKKEDWSIVIILTAVIIIIFAIILASVISNELDKQKNNHYSVYQATRDCQILEKKEFTLGAYYVHNVSKGTYIFKYTSKSGAEYYYFEKGSELICITVEDKRAFKYCGKITEYEYNYTDWKNNLD